MAGTYPLVEVSAPAVNTTSHFKCLKTYSHDIPRKENRRGCERSTLSGLQALSLHKEWCGIAKRLPCNSSCSFSLSATHSRMWPTSSASSFPLKRKKTVCIASWREQSALFWTEWHCLQLPFCLYICVVPYFSFQGFSKVRHLQQTRICIYSVLLQVVPQWLFCLINWFIAMFGGIIYFYYLWGVMMKHSHWVLRYIAYWSQNGHRPFLKFSKWLEINKI